MDIKNIVIIGAGPSGIATAIQLSRHGIKPLIFEKGQIGGMLINANLVENYPGFPKGIRGIELVKLFEDQLNDTSIEIRFEEVTEIDYKNDLFYLNTGKMETTCKILVIASGTKPRQLSIPITTGLFGKNIFYEIHSLTRLENEDIAIIGAGDLAFDYALNLSKKNKITILNRGKNVKCLPLLWDRATNIKNITYRENIQINSIIDKDDGLMLMCNNPEGEFEIYTRYLVIAIGRNPQINFLNQNLMDNLIKLQKSGKLFMIGDVKNSIYRQTAISIGDGIKTGMKIAGIIES